MHKFLRIPAPTPLWQQWCHGNPTKLLRYFKFVGRGWSADDTTRQFIVERTRHYFEGEQRSSSEWFCKYTIASMGDDAANFKREMIRELGEQFWNVNFQPWYVKYS